MKRFAITRGLDLPLTGQPERQIETAMPVQSAGVIGADYPGLPPTLVVADGDQVTAVVRTIAAVTEHAHRQSTAGRA